MQYWGLIAVIAIHISKVAFRFFARTVLIHDPADSCPTNSFTLSAMASNRRVTFLNLVCIRLQAHERASGWSLSGRSRISDSEH